MYPRPRMATQTVSEERATTYLLTPEAQKEKEAYREVVVSEVVAFLGMWRLSRRCGWIIYTIQDGIFTPYTRVATTSTPASSESCERAT